MPLRIAFDLDGVLADMDRELARRAEELFGSALSSSSTDDSQPVLGEPVPYSRLELTGRQQEKLWRSCRAVTDFWETLEETEPGVVSRLATTASERRWEILFLTSRPQCAGDTVQVQTQHWLQRKGFPAPSVYVVQNSRGKIAAALDIDVVVDDRIENCLDVLADSPARAVLVWRDSNGRLPSVAKAGIAVTKSTQESVDLLVQLDAAPGDAGLVEKFKRLLGLKAAALD